MAPAEAACTVELVLADPRKYGFSKVSLRRDRIGRVVMGLLGAGAIAGGIVRTIYLLGHRPGTFLAQVIGSASALTFGGYPIHLARSHDEDDGESAEGR